MTYDPQAIEQRWRERWAESGRYEADPDEDSEATFITVPYPYPSGGMHIGHARTYTVPDVYARYRRQRGDNVLFPIAWHVTGTPIIGAVERLKKGEEAQLETLQEAFHVPKEDLKDLETPMGYARYFIEGADSSYKQGMQALGLSIDWRREFTTNDDRYSQFITWQYETLKEHGLLEKGLHPVKYCTEEENPVTTHDLLEGEEAEFQEYTLIKFREGDLVVPMATLRPETVHGVTNAFVDPEGEYAIADVDGERWLVSVEAVEKLRLQAREVSVEQEIAGEYLVGRHVENPVTGEDVLVLPAPFVDPDNATGVVMSVPGHSPDDWIALEEAKADADRLTEYGIDPDEVRAIEPRSIVDVDDYGEFPAKDAVEAHGIESQTDPALEEVTQEVYNREFHSGRLKDMYGEFAGEVIEDVRDDLQAYYQEQGAFDAMHEFSEEVVCRCGGDVEVAKQDTWFLRYDDAEWKEKTHRAVEGLDAIPENTREQYDHTVDWLQEWPCIRNYGLGTRLPWDDEFVIEPLSDSTIYMSYYTIAHRIDDVPAEDLDRDFFDALFYGPNGEDAPEGVEVDVEDPDERALELREEWDHWYPVDYRCSANDLIQNHLTFYLFHHADLFPQEKWPQGITSMGMGLLEGEKMSSSKGHVVLPGEAIEEFGADTVRFFLLNSAEPWQDYDWRADQVQHTHDALGRFWNRATEIIDGPEGERDLEHVDRWLLAELAETVETVTDALERFETRTASQAAFYDFQEHLRWYRRRTDTDRPGARWTLRQVLRTRLRLLAPFVPFMADELHERLTDDPAQDAPWPATEPLAVEEPAENGFAWVAQQALDTAEIEGLDARETLVRDLTDDVAEVIDVTGTDPDTVRVYVAAGWKRDVFDAVREHGPDRGAIMGAVMDDPDLRERGDEVNQLVGDLVEFVRERPDEELDALASVDEGAVYEDASEFLAREFDAEIEVYAEDADPVDPADKAGNAVPFRPAIHIE
ncbi:MAG TPA: leucine--tRNA ligase [Natrialbaceae archaeon]|nr:leucine--tRNA ligase [Natrialbaceae archaeon]